MNVKVYARWVTKQILTEELAEMIIQKEFFDNLADDGCDDFIEWLQDNFTIGEIWQMTEDEKAENWKEYIKYAENVARTYFLQEVEEITLEV
jgi:hypothetical protein